MFMTAFYLPIIPMSLPIAAFALFINYWAEKVQNN